MFYALHSARRCGRGLHTGFTLIELLVVVLIMGILAAVAIPQYRVAVMKSRFATLIPAVRALADAQEIYYMENGKYATSFEELSVAPPAGGVVASDNPSYITYNGYYCRLFDAHAVYCHGHDYGYYSQYLRYAPSNGTKRFCVVLVGGPNEDIKRQVCRSFGGTKARGDGWEFWTMP